MTATLLWIVYMLGATSLSRVAGRMIPHDAPLWRHAWASFVIVLWPAFAMAVALHAAFHFVWTGDRIARS